MVVTLPAVQVGEPIRSGALTVFPLFGPASSELQYRLADEAIADQQVVVEEVSEGGSVPELRVENKGGESVLFLEGEELVGAKQNRVLNTSVLVAAHSTLKIPVSCVERGRWAYRTRQFGSSGRQATPQLRRTLKASVSMALKAQQGYRSDQAEVWRGIDTLHAKHCVDSQTAAMADAYQAYHDQVAAIREKFAYVAGAMGMAVAMGPHVVSLDYFDQPATCRKVWNRLVSGFVFDALDAGTPDQLATAEDVDRLLAATRAAAWSTQAAVGDGEDWRAETTTGDLASVLSLTGNIVHASVVSAS